MQHAVIDIGSNSMRLTIYEVENTNFKILFKDKIMAGLASYVENGYISEDGIRCAYESLLEFKNTLILLGICENIHVFATASLRNIVNTEEAVAKITAETGFHIDVITGEEETLLGYSGVMHDIAVESGAFTDIGGASTEIAVFSNKSVLFSKSFHVGSLKLYRDCVKKILPGNGSVKRIKETIHAQLPHRIFDGFFSQEQLVATGGTARSVLKFAKHLGLVPEDSRIILADHMKVIADLFFNDEDAAADAILKVDPERIHTIIPGFMILRYIAEQFEAREIVVSNYGVREGYLCQKVLTT